MNILKTIKKAVGIYEHKYIYGIEISRYGASWLNAGGNFNDRDGFIDWMTSLLFTSKKNGFSCTISEDDAIEAYEIMTCGKFELERTVKKYLGNQAQQFLESIKK